MKKWSLIIAMVLLALHAYWTFASQDQAHHSSRDKWQFFAAGAFILAVACICLLLIRYIIKVRIKGSVDKIKIQTAAVKIDKWAKNDNMWNYLTMVENANTTFDTLMHASYTEYMNKLKEKSTPACISQLSAEATYQNTINDYTLENAAIINANNNPGNNQDTYEAIFIGKYVKENKSISFNKKLSFIRENNQWLLNNIKN